MIKFIRKTPINCSFGKTLYYLLLMVLASGVSTTPYAKQRRVLHSDAEIAQLLENVKNYDWARHKVQQIKNRADQWIKLSDEQLWDLFPTAAVPRAVSVNQVKGCPIHGRQIFEKQGAYPWVWSMEKPYQLQCPVGHEWYPTNNYATQYKNSFGKGIKSQIDTEKHYEDDGWGYVDDKGNRYYFVAHYNQLQWFKLRDIPHDCGYAYLVTGDPKYAHKAAVALARIASVYPEMQYAEQSDGLQGDGRIFYGQWETFNVRLLAEPYDHIYPYLLEGADHKLNAFLASKGIPDIRKHIEKNLLQEFAKSLVTNTQMTPGIQGANNLAMTTLAAVWDNNDPINGMTTEQMLEWAWRGEGWNTESLLHNNVYRDGFECEQGLRYNFGMRDQLFQIAQILKKIGHDIWAEPKLKKLLDAPIDVVILGRFTPAMGDSGSLPYSGKIGWGSDIYVPAFQIYRDPRYAKAAGSSNGPNALFEKSPNKEIDHILKEQGADITQKTRNFAGFGLCILERGNGFSGRALSLWYGSGGGGHSHRDLLNIEFFARGQSLIPDLGYPENWSCPETIQWITNTVSHNTVTINATGQTNTGCGAPGRGRLTLFKQGDVLDFAEADGVAAYGNLLNEYSRLVALIDVAAGFNGYAIDIFRIKGGFQHDYSLHGSFADFYFEGAKLPSPDKKGTAAGPNVPYKSEYEQKMSGFQFLYNPQRVKPRNQWSGIWKLRHHKTFLKVTMLPGCTQQVIVADGDPPWKKGGTLKYLLARNQGENLMSTYVAVLQAYGSEPILKSIKRLHSKPDAEDFVALQMCDIDQIHTFLNASRSGTATKRTIDGGITFAGQVGFVAERNNTIEQMYLANGTELVKGSYHIYAGGPVRGRISAIDFGRNAIIIDRELPAGDILKGETIVFFNDKHSATYEIKKVEKMPMGSAILLEDTITELCRCEIKEIDVKKRTIKTNTPILLYTNGMEFPGMSIVNEARTMGCIIEMFQPFGKTGVNTPPFGGLATLGGDLPLSTTFIDSNNDGRTLFFVYDFNVGDEYELANSVSVERLHQWTYRIKSTGKVNLTIPGISNTGTALIHAGEGKWKRANLNHDIKSGLSKFSFDPSVSGTNEICLVIDQPSFDKHFNSNSSGHIR
jgi:hypothetical protein